MRNTVKLLLLLGMVFGLVFPANAGGPFGEDKEKLVIEGSTTVLPIAQAAAESFMQQNFSAEVVVRGGGSGVGIASLLDRNCDIAMSSRPIKDVELDKGVTNKVDPTATVIAMDGLAVIVNPANNINKLSKKQVKDIFAGSISNWSQVGGKDQKIVVISRDSSSGTFEAFGTLVLGGAKVRAGALLQASNQAVATSVAQTPGAIGYVGLGYLTPRVKALEIDGVIPSKETILGGSYPVTRPLFMYTNGKSVGQAKDYIDFILSDMGQELVEKAGFVGLKEKK